MVNYVALLEAILEHFDEVQVWSTYNGRRPEGTEEISEAIEWAKLPVNRDRETPYQLTIEAEAELAMWFQLRFA